MANPPTQQVATPHRPHRTGVFRIPLMRMRRVTIDVLWRLLPPRPWMAQPLLQQRAQTMTNRTSTCAASPRVVGTSRSADARPLRAMPMQRPLSTTATASTSAVAGGRPRHRRTSRSSPFNWLRRTPRAGGKHASDHRTDLAGEIFRRGQPPRSGAPSRSTNTRSWPRAMTWSSAC